ncbi:MAG: hemerythrin domain-containing protein [Magnetospirillum sp.]|nr:hemerythrin domain-containing protein [Magnetospirillum sp.]
MLTQTRTGSLLHQDHMRTIDVLQAIQEMTHRHPSAPAVEGAVRADLERLADTMRAEVERHFGFEENHLFPLFSKQGEMGMVVMLTHEHRAILPLALEAADLAAAALAGGFEETGWRNFRDVAAELVEREIFHIQKEEMGLLAAIAALLDPAADAALSEAYRMAVGGEAGE